ncbi:MAG: glycine cleavage system protein GcvH [Anaerolineales bacterium]|nr:glycine cleavage system protein GcvH [Anaerolineales bacterium]MCB0031667.1 glycine cleavage system protein GcvH [Anaerolineales bacterium]MCB8961671.1 glycine cleavage system protein GcvH [Ardenticatenales bacterium]
MSNIPADLMYTSDDEWVKIEGNIATIGITDYAQDQLSDIVYLELPAVGDVIAVGEAFGVVESVKAASDMYAPLSGTVAEVNEALVDAPEAINDDPYGAWMVKIEMSNSDEQGDLLDATAYEASVSDRS